MAKRTIYNLSISNVTLKSVKKSFIKRIRILYKDSNKKKDTLILLHAFRWAYQETSFNAWEDKDVERILRPWQSKLLGLKPYSYETEAERQAWAYVEGY